MVKVSNVASLFVIVILVGLLIYVYVILRSNVPVLLPLPKMWDELRKPGLERLNHLFHSTPKTSLYVTASIKGRLGNLMFQYASLMGISDLNNVSHLPFFPRQRQLSDVFQVTATQGVRTAKPRFVEQEEIGSCTFDRRFANLPKKNVCACGYLQSWKYFVNISDFIRKEFTFVPSVQQFAQQMLDSLTRGHRHNVTTVGIHVRRGDYVRPLKIGTFKLPPISYFLKAIHYFRRKYPDAMFIVVSTDRWCQPLLELPDVVMAGDASPGQHMALLTLCDHVIMSIGSFGWWAGFLSGGDVVYYNNLTYPNRTSKKGFVHADHFLPEWVGLPD